MRLLANHIHLEVHDTGPPGAPAVLLIMGLGMQLSDWPQSFVDELCAQGFRVIRFDNRDIGLSDRFDHCGKPHFIMESMKLKMGMKPKLAYTVTDMTNDALGVLDGLHITHAHVVGVSMGGMIAQRLALMAPHRLYSLTSIMSSSSDRHLPPPEPQVLKMMMSTPKYGSREDLIAHQVAMFQCIGSPGYPTPAALLTEQVALAHDRGYSRNGVLRQSLAVMADTARAKELAHLRAPTLVIHGKADPLLPYVHGVDTAKRIAGAQLIGIEGMGHDLPTGAMDQFMPALLMHLHKHNPPALQPNHEST